MSVVVYTAIYGEFDTLKPHPAHPRVAAWRCYTDDPELACDGWETIVEPPRYPTPRLAAKWWKCHPPADADWSVWMDGSLRLIHAEYVDVLAGLLDQADIALFRHHRRSTIRDEAQACLDLQPRKVAGVDVHGQVDRYEQRKPTGRLGVWETASLARRHTPVVLALGGAWMAHCELGTPRDQLSLPVLLDDYQLAPAVIGGSVPANPWFAWCGHLRGD